MKKITLVLLIIGTVIQPIVTNPSYAQEETIAEEAQDAIEKIKDAVASKVAELNLVEKRGLFGDVTESSNTQITITDQDGNIRIIEIDELTRFEGERQLDDFGISDIEIGNTISAVGLYNKDSEKLLARFITQKHSMPQNIDGVITQIDSTDFTITITDGKGKSTIVDIETSTDTSEYAGEELTNSGFSQLEIGQRIIVTGFANQDEENRISADRILHFSSIPPSTQMSQYFTLPQSDDIKDLEE